MVAGSNPKVKILFNDLATFKVQAGLFAAYLVGLFWSVEHKKPYSEACLYTLFYPFTLVIMLALLFFCAHLIRAHWIWQGFLIPVLYVSFIGTFFTFWSHKLIWWRAAFVSLIAIILTGVRLDIIC